jgi:cytosine/adenosine deaminase-related metal-dependent hydrolase
VSRPAIEDGAVVISGGRIAAIGTWRSLRAHFNGRVQDLGEMVLLPGLVNAHCHLDYTHMAGLFPPQKKFSDWIKLITTEKAHWTYSDYARSWLDGAKMLVRSGTTMVADIEAVPELLPEVWDSTPLRVLSFLEMTGVRSRRNPGAILSEAVERINKLPQHRCVAGLSPHAPYSAPPKVHQLASVAARRRGWRVTTHLAESAAEFEMFTRGSSEMFEWLRRNQRDMRDCDGRSPVQHMARCGALGRHLLAVHVNYLAPGDAELLGRKRVSVAHCPRSHDYFRHQEFPHRALSRAGVNICLGTDSLATVRKHPRRDCELSMFREMRAFAAKHPEVDPKRIVRMATVNGAQALGLNGKVGELRRGAWADLVAIEFSGKGDTYERIVNHNDDVMASMIGGDWEVRAQK